MSNEGYSDDDFEEYSDDDFEDDEPVPEKRPTTPKVDGPQQSESLPSAISRENQAAVSSTSPDRPLSGQQRPGSAALRPSSAARRISQSNAEPFHVPDLTAPTAGLPHKGILPSRDQLQSDAQRAALSKGRQRAAAVLAAIKLEVVAVDSMYDVMPMSEYDLMAMGRGTYASTAVASVQTNEDKRDSDIQTKPIDTTNARCQAPDDLGVAREDLEAARTGKRKPARTIADSFLEGDSQRKLSSFVRSVGSLILKLLGEGTQSAEPSPFSAAQSGNPCAMSLASLHLSCNDDVRGRHVSAVAYSQDPNQRVLAAFDPEVDTATTIEDHSIRVRGMLCVWDPKQPSQPTHKLLCEGSPTCCCWAAREGTADSYLVFAGLKEGGVCLWDLREPGLRYPAEDIDGVDVSRLRRPTYSTEFMSGEAGAPGAIVALAAVPRSKRTGEGRRSKGNLQLLSCSEWGEVTMWSINEMSEADVGGTSEVDFGLRVGARVRLLKTSAMLRLGMDAARPAYRMPSLTVQRTHDICLLPRDNNEFIVAGDGGRVLLGARYGEAPAPKEFKLEDMGLLPLGSVKPIAAAVASVKTVHFSSIFGEQVFAAGFSDGTIAIFSVLSSLPLKVWSEIIPGEVQKVRWSPIRPGVLFCLDNTGAMHVFDMASSKADTPTIVQLPGGEVTAFEVSRPAVQQEQSDTDPEDGWVSPAAGNSAGSKDKMQHSFAIGFADGHVDVHLFNSDLSQPVAEEYMTVSAFLGLRS